MTRVTIPQLDANLVDVTITAWKKSVGTEVHKGESIAELTTDKAVYELEAPDSGELLEILAQEKSVVPTGYIIALIGSPGECDTEAAVDNTRIMADYRGTPADSVSEASAEYRTRVRATPKARRLARKHNLDLEDIQRRTGAEFIDEDTVTRFIES